MPLKSFVCTGRTEITCKAYTANPESIIKYTPSNRNKRLGEKKKSSNFVAVHHFTCHQLQRKFRQVLGDDIQLGRTVPSAFTINTHSLPLRPS